MNATFAYNLVEKTPVRCGTIYRTEMMTHEEAAKRNAGIDVIKWELAASVGGGSVGLGNGLQSESGVGAVSSPRNRKPHQKRNRATRCTSCGQNPGDPTTCAGCDAYAEHCA